MLEREKELKEALELIEKQKKLMMPEEKKEIQRRESLRKVDMATVTEKSAEQSNRVFSFAQGGDLRKEKTPFVPPTSKVNSTMNITDYADTFEYKKQSTLPVTKRMSPKRFDTQKFTLGDGGILISQEIRDALKGTNSPSKPKTKKLHRNSSRDQ